MLKSIGGEIQNNTSGWFKERERGNFRVGGEAASAEETALHAQV
jgi:hypothetical protein